MHCTSPRHLQAPRCALIALLLLLSTLVVAARPVAASNPFVDVSTGDPAYNAIDQLYALGVIKGYPTNPPTFGPGNKSVRAQMAALIGRAMGWGTGGANPFTDRCIGASCIDDELWGYVAVLASQGVARGYDATTFGPFDSVLQQQVILFISRAKVAKREWTKLPDNPRVYPGSAGSPSDHQDIVTYVAYAGAPPDAPTTFDTGWGTYTSEATRGWFARALWQAYPQGKGPALTEPAIPTSPNTAGFAAQVLALTNNLRQQNGCGPLTFNQQLRDAAQAHAVDMAVQDYFAHNSLDGTDPATRMQRAGYHGSLYAENIAAGYPTPQDVVNAWFNETPPNDGHRRNILNCALTDLGVGYYYLANDTGSVNYHHYWVQDFGAP